MQLVLVGVCVQVGVGWHLLTTVEGGITQVPLPTWPPQNVLLEQPVHAPGTR